MSVNKNILRLAVPSILANITVPLVGLVDISVAGHLDAGNFLSTATLIGGVSIGTMLFDMLYWNFGFLRISTGGLTAQAYGRSDFRESASILSRAVGISFICAFFLLAIQFLFIKLAFLVVDCSPEVEQLASDYFYIRIWASPATLSLMAFKGWFIGMQDSVSSMATDLVVNILNIIVSVILALGIRVGEFSWQGIGFPGIAIGTVVAQYSGLLCAIAIVAFKYAKIVFQGFSLKDALSSFKGYQMRRFFVINGDLFIRSLCFIGIYIGFTSFSAHYGDLTLACGTIIMKIMLLFSYFTDGFAYAGEALTGRFIGAKDRTSLVETVRYVFLWSMSIAVLFMCMYAFAGGLLIEIMTSDAQVVQTAMKFIPWIILMPPAGCAAFTWDGIFIGATASKAIRNSSIYAVAGFFLSYFVGLMFFRVHALNILLAAYLVHLAIRTVYLSLRYKKEIVC